MYSKRLLMAAAAALLLVSVRPARAQGISGDDIGPHVCTQPGAEAPAALVQPLPGWFTMLQARVSALTFHWTAGTTQRAVPAARPVLKRPLAGLLRPRD